MGTFTICQDPDDALKHSEGPWDVAANDDGSFLVVAADLMVVAYRQRCSPYPERSKANALLIAAAPELLAVCQEFISALGPDGYHPSAGKTATDRMRAAISKAEGRS